MQLPKSWAEEQIEVAQNVEKGQSTLDGYLLKQTFSVDLANTVLVIWILRHALPFNRFYDPPLRAAFKLANQKADLQTPTWAAGVAKELYAKMNESVISLVYVSYFVY